MPAEPQADLRRPTMEQLMEADPISGPIHKPPNERGDFHAHESLSTVYNLYALGTLFEVPMDQILVSVAAKLHIAGEQQAESCCSPHFMTGCLRCGKSPMRLQPFVPRAAPAA